MATAADRHSKSGGQGQGQKWIRNEKRLAIYLRDGLACTYCGSTVEDGVRLTLDHLTPHSYGGGNQSENIVTCCHCCNSSRGNRDWREFADKVAAYVNHGITAQQIIAHIEETIRRPIDTREAKEIIARRGGFTAALQNVRS